MFLLSFVIYSSICRARAIPRRKFSERTPLGWNTVRDAGSFFVRRSSSVHIAAPVLVGLLVLAAQPAHAQTTRKKSQPTIARKAASARARAVSPREMA